MAAEFTTRVATSTSPIARLAGRGQRRRWWHCERLLRHREREQQHLRGNTANNGDPTASGGGAICNGDHNHSQGGFLTVINTTITGNTALRGGGISTAGAAAAGFLKVTSSTIVGNSSFFSDSAGGISSDGQGPPMSIKNTIVALNTGSAGRDVYAAFASSGFNLIGKTNGSTGFTAATDQKGTIASPLDPKLDPHGLQDNGGPTQTIALQLGSPAIDKGTSDGLTGSLTTDQRGTGFPRMADYSNVSNASGGDGTDIGAFEGTALKITSMTRLPNAHVLLQGRGTPNRPHTVEASPDLSPNSFVALPDLIMADGTGALQHDDVSADRIDRAVLSAPLSLNRRQLIAPGVCVSGWTPWPCNCARATCMPKTSAAIKPKYMRRSSSVARVYLVEALLLLRSVCGRGAGRDLEISLALPAS